MTTQDWIVPLCRTFAVELVKAVTSREKGLPIPVALIAGGMTVPVIRCVDAPVHTDAQPWCDDGNCLCQGLLTEEEYERLMRGENV